MPDEAVAVEAEQQQVADDNNQQQQVAQEAGQQEKTNIITIPDELRYKVDKSTGAKKEKGWVSKVLGEDGNVSVDKLLQQVDTLESLKGQKTISFDWANAKPEEIKAHLEGIRPESHEVYDFVQGKVAQGTEETIQKLFHDAAIPKPQAEMLTNAYLEIEKAQMARATSAEGFDEVLKESFGDNFQEPATKVGKALKSIYSQEDQQLLEHMPNVFLGLMYRGIHKVMEDYGVTESALGATSHKGVGGVNSVDSLKADMKKNFDALQSMQGTHYTQQQKTAALEKYQKSVIALAKAEGELK